MVIQLSIFLGVCYLSISEQIVGKHTAILFADKQPSIYFSMFLKITVSLYNCVCHVSHFSILAPSLHGLLYESVVIHANMWHICFPYSGVEVKHLVVIAIHIIQKHQLGTTPCTFSLKGDIQIHDTPNKHPPYKVYMGLIIKGYHP